MARSLKDLLTLLPSQDQENAQPMTRVQSEPTLDQRFARLLTREQDEVVPVIPQQEDEPNPFLYPDPKNLVRPRPALVTLETPNPALDQDVADMLKAQEQGAAAPASIEPQLAETQTEPSSNFYDTLIAASNAAAGMSQAASGVKTQPDLAFLEDLRNAPKREQELEASRARIQSERLNQEAVRQTMAQKGLDFANEQRLKDPDSEESVAFREQFFSMFPQYKDMPGFKNASAFQLDNTFKQLNLKEQIENRMQQAQLKREEAASARADKASQRMFELKEKEQFKIDKEDRELRRQLDKNEETMKVKIGQIEKALNLVSDFANSGITTDTGPLDQYVARATPEGQILEQALNELSLNKMVEMFSGMSKAVDTDAERAKFESTQANLGLYPKTNTTILKNQLEAARDVLSKIQKAKRKYDNSGSFDDRKQEPSKTQTKAAQFNPETEIRQKQSDGSVVVYDKKTLKPLRKE